MAKKKITPPLMRARLGCGLTRPQLAAATGIDASVIHRYEEGRLPAPREALVIALALGSTVDQLWMEPPLERSAFHLPEADAKPPILGRILNQYGYSTRRTAKLTEIPRATVINLRNGAMPKTIEPLLKLARLLKCTAQSLVEAVVAEHVAPLVQIRRSASSSIEPAGAS